MSALPEPPHQPVWVRWLDIVMDGHETWIDPKAEDRKAELEMIDSVGMLVEERPDLIVIVSHQCTDGDIGHRSIIPRGCVISMTKLNPVRVK